MAHSIFVKTKEMIHIFLYLLANPLQKTKLAIILSHISNKKTTMIGRRIKISKDDRRNIVKYLETMPSKIAEQFLKDIGLPAQMHKIIVLRFLKRNKIKDVQTKLNLTQDIISDRTTQALNIILNYIKLKDIDITR